MVCPIANTYTKDEVVDLMEGFDVISIEQDHIFPYQIEPYKRGEYLKQPWFESMPQKCLRLLKKSWLAFITKRLNEDWCN